MTELTEARRAALRRFVERAGGYSAVEEKFGLSASRKSYLSQLITPGSKAAFGERSARKWQEILQMEGDPLLAPALDSERGGKLSLHETIDRLGEILRAVPIDQREVISSVLSAYAKRPVGELGAALITLLESKDI